MFIRLKKESIRDSLCITLWQSIGLGTLTIRKAQQVKRSLRDRGNSFLIRWCSLDCLYVIILTRFGFVSNSLSARYVKPW